MNSREKGKRGERQWRDELRAHGYDARRGQQFSGSPDSPDVVCEALGWIHFEVKAVERLNVEDAMEQARGDCRISNAECGLAASHPGPVPDRGGEGVGKVPVLAHRRNFRGWLVTMDAETFFKFLRGALPPMDVAAAPSTERLSGARTNRRLDRRNLAEEELRDCPHSPSGGKG